VSGVNRGALSATGAMCWVIAPPFPLGSGEGDLRTRECRAATHLEDLGLCTTASSRITIIPRPRCASRSCWTYAALRVEVGSVR
jgi:hypothetical protein